MNETIDDTDIRILKSLIRDAKRSHKEIGEEVHLTGQAVGARVRKLHDLGVIEGYTVKWNPERLGLGLQAFVTIFLNSGDRHAAFREFMAAREDIVEVHRVSGEGCYLMIVRTGTMEQLGSLLEAILPYGNYRMNLSVGIEKSE
ncbi:Lrp/AsnC family transcriptional regulator [Paenibacillus taichungensis]|jgi:Lrp/AsnC family leucine-responsive transcriptional regulator|uniref:Lrp/AsnC family transcriptional regulator n=2 Tax=Paenibacillus TaxID=44249 RepID=A0ABX2MVP1_9BACL|nr:MULTISPECIES: Lrp/AsnC family transcriptional regulator [Paenibacillus]MEC0106546.1 Lrp/AsnC family transcriptional regulator [Paenibacillus taichungensis]MEC0198470.1 Lrp/AsnC family transcriptional regulator [Paenibacillus taichungensis]NUU58148.1 Lrp/AsnC family transcriptional regulator [Paenibacillus taichungensis]